LTSSEIARLRPADVEALESRGASMVTGDPSRAAGPRPRIWILCAKFNGGISARMCDGALDAFYEHGLSPDAIRIGWVPGAFELPLAAKRSIRDGGASAVLCLGAVIRGGTPHFDFVAGECAAGIRQVGLETCIPVVFGVLTTNTVDQAMQRSTPGKTNKGYEAAITALEMLDLLTKFQTGAPDWKKAPC
jgi:6,7-dimethyl-8-ribityllumazine synthase